MHFEVAHFESIISNHLPRQNFCNLLQALPSHSFLGLHFDALNAAQVRNVLRLQSLAIARVARAPTRPGPGRASLHGEHTLLQLGVDRLPKVHEGE